jgi:hypothetical protein
MFTIIRCVVRNTQTSSSKVKVTLGGQSLIWSVVWYILFPVHNILIHQRILRILNSQPNSAGINDLEGLEKYNNTEVKYGTFFTAATRHLSPAVVKYKILETK